MSLNPTKVASAFLKLAYDFSSVQFDFPPDIAQEIMNWGLKNIPNNILATDGRETQIHVTCLYGLHITDFTKVRNLFVPEVPFEITLGDISIFENEDADVVKIEIQSPDLHRLNKLIQTTFDVTLTHKEYIPHATICYVKKGCGAVYDGRKDFKGRKILLDTVVFSGKDNRKTQFKLVPLDKSVF
jgi:hypothetical protein